MGTVLLVQIESSLASALERSGAEVAGARFELAPSPELVGDLARRTRFDAVVLGATLEDPLQIAQSARAGDEDVSVVILAEPSRCERVNQSLRFSPLALGDIRCRPVGDPWDVLRDVSNAVEVTRRRRRHRQTLDAVNVQLRGIARPQVSEVTSLGRVLDLAPVGVSAVDTEGRVIAWNRRAAGIFERGEEDMLGRALVDFLPPDAAAQWRDVLARAGDLDVPVRIPFQRRRPEAEVQHLELSVAPLLAASGVGGLMLLFEDVTERVNAESERLELLRRTQAALAVRDEFLSVASHELRTPLTSLRLVVQALGRELGPEGEDLDRGRLGKRVQTAERQVMRLTRLVEGLLDVSSVQSGRLRLERALVDLGELVQRTVSELHEDFIRAGCEARVAVQDGVKGAWDERRLQQVLVHLLTNALRYAPNTTVDVVVSGEERNAVLEVIDRGTGIDEQDLERIFERFERAAPSRNYGGLGLGLFISRKIVDAHGGTIHARSRPGQGASFRIELPR